MSKRKLNNSNIIFDLPNNRYAEKIKTQHNIDLGYLFSLKQRVINDKITENECKHFIKGYLAANRVYNITKDKIEKLTEDIYNYLKAEKIWEE